MSITAELEGKSAKCSRYPKTEFSFKQIGPPVVKDVGPLRLNLLNQYYPWYPNLMKHMEELSKSLRESVVIIDFDTDPSGKAIKDGTQLDVLGQPYESLGVSFTAIPGPQAPSPLHVWIRCDSVENISPPNVVTLVAPPQIGIADSDRFGRIRVSFAWPRSFVTVSARVLTPFEMLSPGLPPYLNGYDSGGKLLASAQFPIDQVPTTNCSSSQPVELTISAQLPGISYVEFSCAYDPSYDALYGVFDTLVFSRFGPAIR